MGKLQGLLSLRSRSSFAHFTVVMLPDGGHPCLPRALTGETGHSDWSTSWGAFTTKRYMYSLHIHQERCPHPRGKPAHSLSVFLCSTHIDTTLISGQSSKGKSVGYIPTGTTKIGKTQLWNPGEENTFGRNRLEGRKSSHRAHLSMFT